MQWKIGWCILCHRNLKTLSVYFRKIFYIHYNNTCLQHCNIDSCTVYITAVSYKILSHVHVFCLSSNCWEHTKHKPTSAQLSQCNISPGKYDRELGNSVATTKFIHTISTLAIFSKFTMSLSLPSEQTGMEHTTKIQIPMLQKTS